MAKRACRLISNRTACLIVAYLCIVIGSLDVLIKIFFHNYELRQKQNAQAASRMAEFFYGRFDGRPPVEEDEKTSNGFFTHSAATPSLQQKLDAEHDDNTYYDPPSSAEEESLLRTMQTLRTIINAWSVLPWLDFPQGLVLSFAVMGGRKRGLSIFLVIQAIKLSVSFLTLPYRLGKHMTTLLSNISSSHAHAAARDRLIASSGEMTMTIVDVDDNNNVHAVQMLPIGGGGGGGSMTAHGNEQHASSPWLEDGSGRHHPYNTHEFSSMESLQTYHMFAWLQIVVLPLQIFMFYTVYMYLRELHGLTSSSMTSSSLSSSSSFHSRHSHYHRNQHHPSIHDNHHYQNIFAGAWPTISAHAGVVDSRPASVCLRSIAGGRIGGGSRNQRENQLTMLFSERPPPAYDEIVHITNNRANTTTSVAAAAMLVGVHQRLLNRAPAGAEALDEADGPRVAAAPTVIAITTASDSSTNDADAVDAGVTVVDSSCCSESPPPYSPMLPAAATATAAIAAADCEAAK